MTAPEGAVATKAAPRVVIRLDYACGGRIGHGKVALLEAVARTGSIAAAARGMAISYPRALAMVAEVDALPGGPAVARAAGGTGGGRATLTGHGAALVARYRAIEAAAQLAAAAA
jgi:molybdate transport system regulatory protein